MAEQDSESIRISNEYATVVVRTLQGGEEDYLTIESPKLDCDVKLRVEVVQQLIKQDKDFFTGLLKHPYGPDK
jgi:hypothetical protein